MRWKRLVFDKEGNVLKEGYTLCLLDKLQDSLKRRDIYVENSDRWGDTRTKLLQGIDWHNNRIQICRLLGHSLAPNDAIIAMTNRLDTTYKKVAANFDNNNAIKIDHSGKHPTVTITNLDKLETPSTLTFLSEQIAGLLPQVTVQASELIRSLLKSDKPPSLAKAIIEVARINKTLYLLNYIDDEDYRRRILTQLNRGEGRHSVARIICHGQRGEIRKRYREGQEDQLGALGLVTNAVVLWNTIYMDAARNYLEQKSVLIKEEDEARLSPMQYGHINVLGHYAFVLSEKIMQGELRPFNQIADDIEDS